MDERAGENRHVNHLSLFAKAFCEFEVYASKNQICATHGIDGSVLHRPNSCQITMDRFQDRCKECEGTLRSVHASFQRVQKSVQILSMTDINHQLTELDTEVLRRFRKSHCGPRKGQYWNSEPFVALQQKVLLVLEKHRWAQKRFESSLVDRKLSIVAKDITIFVEQIGFVSFDYE